MNQNSDPQNERDLYREEPAGTGMMPPPAPPGKKNWIFSLVFIAIAALTFWAVTAQIGDFSVSEFMGHIRRSDPGWLMAAVVSMLGFIVFEGVALLVITRSFGYGKSPLRGFVWSAGDIYFSAITPSATGGQPASAFFMIKDGIPGMVTAVSLVVNLVMYTLSILAIALICFAARPRLFLNFNRFSQALIIVGVVMQVVLAVFFVMLLKREKTLHRICDAFLRLLARLHLLRKPEEKREKLRLYMEDYVRYAQMLRGRGRMLLWAFLFNFLQRAAQIAVTMFVFLATGGAPAEAFDVWVLQGFVVLGSNCVPIPGAMGVSDYLMLDCYRGVHTAAGAGNLELLSRSVSFYICILICGVVVLAKYIALRKRKRRNRS